MRSKIAFVLLIPFLVGCTSHALSPVTQLPQAGQSRQVQSIQSMGGTFTTIDNPNGVNGPVGTALWGINPQGDIVGNYWDSNVVMHGFLWHDGVFTPIEDPKAGNGSFQGTQPSGISASGEIVGSYRDSTGVLHGFILRGGRFTTIDNPLGISTSGHGINANGDIVGNYVDSSIGLHGYRFDGHKYTTIDVPGAPQGAQCGTVAQSINPSGDITLYTACGTSPNNAFLFHDGQFTSIDNPSASGQGTVPFGISPQGIIVGGYNLPDLSNSFGFILCEGVYTTLNDPLNVFGDQLNGITPSGDIIGLYLDDNFIAHGFLYHPVSGARRGNCDEGGTTANLAGHITEIPARSGHHGLQLPAIR